jgi:hypothetical protein
VQGGYRAAHAAEEAWLIWDELSPDTRRAVADMLVYEADSYIDYEVPYWRNADGSTNFPGDTKAEENAWNAHLPALAQAMMPDHPNVAAWRRKASELQVSTYSCESDLSSSQLIDGKPLKDWLKGFNSFPDGVLVNHKIVHPDYMSSYAQIWLVVPHSLARQNIPQSTIFNFDRVYRALTEIEFVAGEAPYGTGKIHPPGGTIYRRTTDGGYDGNVYYPQSNDWTLEVTDGYLNADLVAEWLGLDRGKPFDSMGWARARLKAIVALQNRPSHDGNISEAKDSVRPSPRGVDEDFFRSNAVAWLQWCLMQHERMSPIADYWGPVSVPDTDACH